MTRQEGRKPVKRRSTPKAGPKKRRAKAEAQAKPEPIQKVTRRAGKIKRYNIDGKHVDRKPAKIPMGKPKNESDIPFIIRWLDRHEDDERFDGPLERLRHFQKKVCEHGHRRVIATLSVEKKSRKIVSCSDCGEVH